MITDEKKNSKAETMTVRNVVRRAAFMLSIPIVAVSISLSVAQSVDAAGKSKKPVDKTGLDVLCSGQGDVYSPPNKNGVSSCLFNDGEVLVCDSKKDKCYASLTQDNTKPDHTKATIVEGAFTLRLLKLLNDKVDNLTGQVQSLTAGQTPPTQR